MCGMCSDDYMSDPLFVGEGGVFILGIGGGVDLDR